MSIIKLASVGGKHLRPLIVDLDKVSAILPGISDTTIFVIIGPHKFEVSLSPANQRQLVEMWIEHKGGGSRDFTVHG